MFVWKKEKRKKGKKEKRKKGKKEKRKTGKKGKRKKGKKEKEKRNKKTKRRNKKEKKRKNDRHLIMSNAHTNNKCACHVIFQTLEPRRGMGAVVVLAQVIGAERKKTVDRHCTEQM